MIKRDHIGGAPIARKIGKAVSLVLLCGWPIGMYAMIMAGDSPQDESLVAALYTIAYYLAAGFPLVVGAIFAFERLLVRVSKSDKIAGGLWMVPLAVFFLSVALTASALFCAR